MALAADWLAAREGPARLQPEQREELRTVLQRELMVRAGVKGGSDPSVIQQEVERFLDIGRVSESNLGRLERRVLRTVAGALADDGARSMISDFSGSKVSQRLGSMSAREPVSSTSKAMMSSLPENQPLTAREPQAKWSELNKANILSAEIEKAKKKELKLIREAKMRQDLQVQLDEKERRRLDEVEDQRRIAKSMEADLEQYKEQEAVKAAEHTKKVMEEKVVRESQVTLQQKAREAEKQKLIMADKKLVKIAEKQMKEEVRVQKVQKEETKSRALAVAKEWYRDKNVVIEERKARHEWELGKVEEYKRMAAEQEERNKMRPKIPRGANAPKVALGARRGEEAYSDEAMKRKLVEDNLRKDEEERRKKESVKQARLKNQEYLFQQMANKERLRRDEYEKSGKGHDVAQMKADVEKHNESERKRMAQQKDKNMQYRVELERQINMKRERLAKKLGEDDMSQAEKAINRHLLEEASAIEVQANQILGSRERRAPRPFQEDEED